MLESSNTDLKMENFNSSSESSKCFAKYKMTFSDISISNCLAFLANNLQ